MSCYALCCGLLINSCSPPMAHLGGPQRSGRDKIKSGYFTHAVMGSKCGQRGYTTPAVLGVPSAQRRDKIQSGSFTLAVLGSQVWAKRQHNP